MDDQAPKKFVAMSIFFAALSFIFYRDIKYIIDSSFFKDKYILIVGVLSAPENDQKRTGLRNTWLKLASDIPITYYFVIGENICGIHPMDRVSSHTCVENWLSLPDNVSSETEFSTMKNKKVGKESKSPVPVDAAGFGFHTLSGITVKKLGVMRRFLENVKGDVRVRLISSSTKRTLASVTIDGSPPGKGDFVLKSIRPVSLPRDAEAQLVVEPVHGNLIAQPGCATLEWDTVPGVINYIQLIHPRDMKPWPFRLDSCSYAVMKYVVSDVNGLRDHISGKEQRRKEWRLERRGILQKLRNESNTYGDILFLDVVDVYRNLPRKLIYFFRKIMETEYFHYILKADDDSFVDLLRVYTRLETVNKEFYEEFEAKMDDDIPGPGWIASIRLSQLWWWSSFREFWRVQESGKWRDDAYRSAAYPSFPCGGGYVLNRGIVEHLSNNWQNLQYFQGEDVSVGIWLSGLKTTQYRPPSLHQRPARHGVQRNVMRSHGNPKAWTQLVNLVSANRSHFAPDICEWTCDNKKFGDIPLCNKVQLTESEMYLTWNKYKEQGFI